MAIFAKEEVDEKLILLYIQGAIENEKQGKKFKPEKKAIIISDYFEKELKGNKNLEDAFLKYTPYKQKEFLEYIETAKREETKLLRMVKIKPMILEKIGLNYKHR